MKFYDCQTAPSPRRARIFIAEKGLNIETVQVDLATNEQLSPAFRAINPRCTVPVLVLDDGTMLEADLVVACEGRGSLLRRRAGAEAWAHGVIGDRGLVETDPVVAM
jgi:glutaredoxin